MTGRKAFWISSVVSLVVFAIGIGGILAFGGELPGWLLTAVLALVMLAALVYGFSEAVPRLGWLRSRPVRGAALVCLGVAAVFVPVPFVVAALCVGAGTRMVWASACELEAGPPVKTEMKIIRPRTEIVYPGEADGEMSPVERSSNGYGR